MSDELPVMQAQYEAPAQPRGIPLAPHEKYHKPLTKLITKMMTKKTQQMFHKKISSRKKRKDAVQYY